MITQEMLINRIIKELGMQSFTRDKVLPEFNKLLSVMKVNGYIDEKMALFCSLVNSGMGIHAHGCFDSIYNQAKKDLQYCIDHSCKYC